MIRWQNHRLLHHLKKSPRYNTASATSNTASITTTARIENRSLTKNTKPNESAKIATSNCQSLILVFGEAVIISKRVLPPTSLRPPPETPGRLPK
jgi:hypothetical protein